MSPEFDIRRNRRSGKEFTQLFIPKTYSLEKQVETIAKYYGIDGHQIHQVLADVGGVMLEGKEYLIRAGRIQIYTQQYKRERQVTLGNAFEKKLRGMEIPFSHVFKLLGTLTDDLAGLDRDGNLDQNALDRRFALAERLREKIVVGNPTS